MKKNLVIVESPAKSKTIEKYLGPGYKVVSSKGHIRDLATTGKYGLGVDIDNNFEPSYTYISGKKKLVSELKKDVKEADRVYLATDPDREGEAISWHLKEALGIKDKDYDRVLFHEITHDKVIDAFKEPRKIDDDLVKSQETRRILDRIIGFRLSKLMQSKTGGTSAGRVQSVALKLIVDREREIKAFVPEEYWTITANFENFEAELFEYKNKKIEIPNEQEANRILTELTDTYHLEKQEEKLKNKKSKPPFITSTLQQEASTKLGFPAKKTMSLAQKLYEGIDLGSETVGLITYMRTDSVRLSDEFIGASKNYIEKNYGKDYVGYTKQAKSKENVQDAHEAIRPTSILRTPSSVKEYLSNDEFKLYRIIYYRALASIMADAKVNQTTVVFNNQDYLFKTTGQVLVFDGYLKVYADYESSEDKVLPEFTDENYITNDVEKKQHFTSPPSRYTEAKLIQEMEKLGIGRPSTYATIISNIKDRGYVNLEDKKFVPTDVGVEVTDKLQEFFSDIINVEYTANMENDLDKIATHSMNNIKVLTDFYQKFDPILQKAFGEMEKAKPQETGEVCPECGSPLVIRKGRYGEFTACSNYPTCKYIKKEEKQVKELMTCPICKTGKIVEKKTKRGKIFYGCNNYPKCKTATWDIPTGEICPECGNLLVEKNNKIKCSNANCKYEK
ncbi:MAG: type I DNA topoisomerase [Tenericutes bacterium]|nr:type I DNA topoisomerase [Mycoplasmatota bacterium]